LARGLVEIPDVRNWSMASIFARIYQCYPNTNESWIKAGQKKKSS
jgi:hypothetical protein